ncbi:amidohydrolase family protein [Limnohabitans sp.]|jgi:predicted TIM-barrel fold metal-dependent hydrolase|uniref:amidohydrolase family protein n=1 Tax=Limnohabitans sp. TaxID=1907725 RepID=UPI0039BCEF83|nr:amidohydrolase [Comamonadaceae bacterium]
MTQARKPNLLQQMLVFLSALVACLNANGYSGPLIDGHAHWGNAFVTESVLDRYRSSGVMAQIVMPRYLGVREDPPTTDEAVIAIAQSHPGQIFVLAGMQRPDFTFMDWNAPSRAAQKILSEIDQKLAQRQVVGIGEVLVRHWAYAGDGGQIGRHAEINQPFDSVFIRQIASVALRHDVPVVIHMEAYPDLVDQLGRVLNELPQLKLVWAHGCGRSNPTQMQALLGNHPALYCDLSNMTNTGGYGSGWPRAEFFTSKMEEDGVFLDPYKAVILNFPDRFFVGMDVAHQSRWVMQKGNTFEKRVQRTRALLGQLPIETARKLAYENAIRIFNIPLQVDMTTQR